MVRCGCGRRAVVRTCWNNVNAGRRYYGCPVEGYTCPINGWYDAPVQPGAREVILYLRRHIHRNEAALQECLAGLMDETMEVVNAGDREIELKAAHQASLADLLLEKEKVCRLRNLCVFSWIIIILACIWFI